MLNAPSLPSSNTALANNFQPIRCWYRSRTSNVRASLLAHELATTTQAASRTHGQGTTCFTEDHVLTATWGAQAAAPHLQRPKPQQHGMTSDNTEPSTLFDADDCHQHSIALSAIASSQQCQGSEDGVADVPSQQLLPGSSGVHIGKQQQQQQQQHVSGTCMSVSPGLAAAEALLLMSASPRPRPPDRGDVATGAIALKQTVNHTVQNPQQQLWHPPAAVPEVPHSLQQPQALALHHKQQQQQQLHVTPSAAVIPEQQQQQQQQQRHRRHLKLLQGPSPGADPSLRSGAALIRVANSTCPTALAHHVLKKLLQQQQQQRQHGRNSSTKPTVLCCSSSTSLLIGLWAAGIASQQAAALPQPQQLLLQPQMVRNALLMATNGGTGAALYQLQLYLVPTTASASTPATSSTRSGGAAATGKSAGSRNSSNKVVDSSSTTDGAIGGSAIDQCQLPLEQAEQSDCSATSRSARSKKQCSMPHNAIVVCDTFNASPDRQQQQQRRHQHHLSQQQQQQPRHVQQMAWHISGLLRGAAPAGLAVRLPAGALLAVKALVRARQHLAAAAALDLMIAVQSPPSSSTAAQATQAAGDRRTLLDHQSKLTSSSSSRTIPAGVLGPGSPLLLWVVAVPAAAQGSHPREEKQPWQPWKQQRGQPEVLQVPAVELLVRRQQHPQPQHALHPVNAAACLHHQHAPEQPQPLQLMAPDAQQQHPYHHQQQQQHHLPMLEMWPQQEMTQHDAQQSHTPSSQQGLRGRRNRQQRRRQQELLQQQALSQLLAEATGRPADGPPAGLLSANSAGAAGAADATSSQRIS